MRKPTALPSHHRTAAFLLLVAMAAAPGAGQADTVRGPDAHVLARPRGDVLTDRRASAAADTHTRTAYAAPYPGWTYARLRIGQRIRPGFWRPAYVVTGSDLPPAGANRRWIRYGDDRVLVDVRSGRVVRVIGNLPLTPPR